jgi:hypothetical protein
VGIFRHVPVHALDDCTQNWEQLEAEVVLTPALATLEKEVKELKEQVSALNSEPVAGLKTVAMAYRKEAFSIPSGAVTKVPVDTVINDPEGLFNLVEGVYVAPSTGYYNVQGEVLINTSLALPGFGEDIQVVRGLAQIDVGGAAKIRGSDFSEASGILGAVCGGIVHVAAGSKIELATFQLCETKAEARGLLVANGEVTNRLSVVRVA